MTKLQYKNAVIDLDGTLLTSKKMITQENKNALLEYQALGGQIILASGRSPQSVAWHAKILGLSGWHIGYDGNAFIYMETPDSKPQIEYIRTLDDAIYPLLQKWNSNFDFQSIVMHQTEFFLEPGSIFSKPSPNFQFPQLEDESPIDPSDWIEAYPIYCKEDWLEKASTLPLHRAAVYGEQGLDSVLRDLNKGFFSYQLSNSSRSIEIAPMSINKGNSLFKLADQIGFSMEETIAFGDGRNDIAMLSAVGRGIAMINGLDEVRKVAYAATESNDHDGVAKGLKKWAYA